MLEACIPLDIISKTKCIQAKIMYIFEIKGVGGGEAAANTFDFNIIHDISLYTFIF